MGNPLFDLGVSQVKYLRIRLRFQTLRNGKDGEITDGLRSFLIPLLKRLQINLMALPFTDELKKSDICWLYSIIGRFRPNTPLVDELLLIGWVLGRF